MNQDIHQQLDAAESVLRANLDRSDLDSIAREHLARALVHVREAFVATYEPGTAPSVQRLADEAARVQRMCQAIHRRLKN